MIIQINTSHSIHGSEEVNNNIKETMMNSFDRFKDRITRLEVHFHDENATKGGPSDKSCMIEARLAGKQPITVDHSDATLASAINGATHKMIHRLDSTLGRESSRS